jgi:hypothetical protein
MQKLGKDKLIAYQASERGGILGIIVTENKVTLNGKAVTFINGFIEL